jgi:transcriptional regulator with GAF, ATPase, and Fis domain
VLKGKVASYPYDVQRLFPRDRDLVELGAESYLGIPIFGATGQVIGHLAILHDRPMEQDERRVPTLKIFAARAGAELQRQRAEEALRKALTEVEELKNRLQAENVYLQEEIRREHDFVEMVGNSPALLAVLRKVEHVAPTDSTVLITGESGTGKGLVARKIHQLSQRSRRPFITVDCGTLVETLFESELFGHVKGSFTGADANKIGKFELAQHGTLFFDEISNISLEVQAKLLRAVEERKISKVGSHRVITVDVRIIAATNKDLARAIKDGTFREDLFYRLNVVLIQMPPLRERKGDIPLLVQHFLEKYNARLRKNIRGISPEALDLLVRHDWPGNVRELENTMERLVVLSTGPYLEPADLAFAGTILQPSLGSSALSLKDLERDHILQTLQRFDGHKSEAARALGIDRKTLREKLRRYNIE